MCLYVIGLNFFVCVQSVWYLCLYVIGLLLCDSHFAGGIYWDRPYGLKIAEWDQESFSEEMDKMAFSHINIINTCTNTCLVTHQHFRDITPTIKACEKSDYKDAFMFHTYKPAQNASVRNNLVNACDCILIHYRGGMKTATQKKFPRGMNPTHRHNFLATPLLHSKTTINFGGEPINPCEKHPLIAYHLSKILFEMGKPVLVIGSGSGGEVVGLLRAGFSVVAVDSDAKQMVDLRARLMTEAHSLEANKLEMDEFYQQAYKDFSRCQMELTAPQIDALWPPQTEEDEEVVTVVNLVKDVVPQPAQRKISGDCKFCNEDLNGAESMWCPFCDKVARHVGCMVKCPTGVHVGCEKTCVSECGCVLPEPEAPVPIA